MMQVVAKPFSDYVPFSNGAGSPGPMKEPQISQLDHSGELNSYGSDSEREVEIIPIPSYFRLIQDVAKKRFENPQLLQERGYDVTGQTTLYQVQLTDHPKATRLQQYIIAGQCRNLWLVEDDLKEAIEGKAVRIKFKSYHIELSFPEEQSKTEASDFIASEDSDDIDIVPLEQDDIDGIISGSNLSFKV